jgi:hypothetical protein
MISFDILLQIDQEEEEEGEEDIKSSRRTYIDGLHFFFFLRQANRFFELSRIFFL